MKFVFTEMGLRYQKYVVSILYCHAHFYKKRIYIKHLCYRDYRIYNTTMHLKNHLHTFDC